MEWKKEAAQLKQIRCLDDLGNAIGTVTAARIPPVSKTIKGHRWQLRLDGLPKAWRDSPGLYEWRILNRETGKPLAVYVGQATQFKDRLPQYWRDMSPQLVEYRHGSTAITTKGCRRREKYRLR